MRSSEFRGTLFRRKWRPAGEPPQAGTGRRLPRSRTLEIIRKAMQGESFWVNSEVCENTSVAIMLGLKDAVCVLWMLERGLHAWKIFLTGTHRACGASTSLSPLPLENTGLSIVPPIRKGNCNLPSFKVAPDSRAMVLVKKLSLVVISANPR